MISKRRQSCWRAGEEEEEEEEVMEWGSMTAPCQEVEERLGVVRWALMYPDLLRWVNARLKMRSARSESEASALVTRKSMSPESAAPRR